MGEGYSPQEGGGVQRTDCHCHNCNGNFVAELDFDLNGDHEIHCPRCAHIHYRTIKDGKVTEARYSSDNVVARVDGRSTWVAGVVKKGESGKIEGAKVSTVALFLRERWLNRSDYGA